MSRPVFSCLMLSMMLVSSHASKLIAQNQAPPPSFSPDRVLVAFQPGATASEIQAAHNQVGARVIGLLEPIGVQTVSVHSGTVLTAVERYRQNPNVRYAEPNYIRPLFQPTTNEGSEPTLGISNNFDEQWGLHNTGQSFGATVDPIFGILTAPAYAGAVDADIDAPEAWNLTHGSPSVRIAILDSGVSCSHVDLDSKCVEQVNFVAEHGSPLDDLLGHGTHVAGIAAAETNNGIGIAGVARDSTIGSLKVCYEDYSLAILGIIQGLCEDQDIIEAIIYAADMGFDVINMSLAGPQASQALRDAVDYAWSHDVVSVAGAGNNYTADRQYPAAFANVIAVAATDHFDNLAYFSTFSTDSDDWVSISAPGHIVFSSVPGELCGLAPDDPEGCYDWKSGTSMATPVVAGMAALLRAYRPGATNAQIRTALEQSADATGALGQNHLAWTAFGRANLFKALMYDSGGPGGNPGDTTPPVITNVASTQLSGPSFRVTWESDEPATTVLILTCCGQFTESTLLTSHSVTVKGRKNFTYEYYVRSVDASGNTATAGPFIHQN